MTNLYEVGYVILDVKPMQDTKCRPNVNAMMLKYLGAEKTQFGFAEVVYREF